MGDGLRQGSGGYFDTHFPDPDSSVLTLAIILIVLWALGLLGGHMAGGLLHLLLVIAVVMLLLRFASGRRVL
jgi:hypothetical protein